MKRLKTKKEEWGEDCVEPQGWDKDREGESVDGIAHCDFAKRKEAERCDTCAWKHLIAVGGNVMLKWDVHSCLCVPRVRARVQPLPESTVCVCVCLRQWYEGWGQRADDVKQNRWSESMKWWRNDGNEYAYTRCICLSVSNLFSSTASKSESALSVALMIVTIDLWMSFCNA